MAQITKRHHDTGLFRLYMATYLQKQVKFMMVADVLFLQHFPPFIVYVYVLVQ